MFSRLQSAQLILGTILGSLIACSPTKFAQSKKASELCDSSVTTCNVETQSIDIVQKFQIGSGKVDILFVNDNSASMSKTQLALAAKFSGFIQSLDARKIDYRIAITTTDLGAVRARPLIAFGNGSYYITNSDANRVNLFNNAILRNETINCEDLIVSMFNTYGTAFQSSDTYVRLYPTTCPSSDTRGIYTANVVVSQNASAFMRADANLNVILISNDNVRQGKTMENNDRAAAFVSMMQSQYPNKYWDFNSIIVKDETCRQSQTLRNAQGVEVRNAYGPAISGGIGLEYANLSNSAARDIDNNPRPRGQILNLCESNYASHFSSMSTQISDESRMITLKCAPSAQPTVNKADGSGTVNFIWNGDKIVFPRGNEGVQVSIAYKCYTGPT